MTDDLVRRLRLRRNHGDMMRPRMLLVNPDGDEAAARIEELEAALRRIAEMHRGKPAHDIARAALAKDQDHG